MVRLEEENLNPFKSDSKHTMIFTELPTLIKRLFIFCLLSRIFEELIFSIFSNLFWVDGGCIEIASFNDGSAISEYWRKTNYSFKYNGGQVRNEIWFNSFLIDKDIKIWSSPSKMSKIILIYWIFIIARINIHVFRIILMISFLKLMR